MEQTKDPSENTTMITIATGIPIIKIISIVPPFQDLKYYFYFQLINVFCQKLLLIKKAGDMLRLEIYS